jgi:hypothetical protein
VKECRVSTQLDQVAQERDVVVRRWGCARHECLGLDDTVAGRHCVAQTASEHSQGGDAGAVVQRGGGDGAVRLLALTLCDRAVTVLALGRTVGGVAVPCTVGGRLRDDSSAGDATHDEPRRQLVGEGLCEQRRLVVCDRHHGTHIHTHCT